MEWIRKYFVNIVPILLIIGAIITACLDVEGWGWFLALGILLIFLTDHKTNK
jgi:hypothetical protein